MINIKGVKKWVENSAFCLKLHNAHAIKIPGKSGINSFSKMGILLPHSAYLEISS
jgi:hypothetical protein